MTGISIFLAILVGLISALLAHLIAKKSRKQKSTFTALFLLLFLVLGALSWRFALPALKLWKFEREVDRHLVAIAAYQEIRRHDPGAYAQIRTQIVESVLKGEGLDQAIVRARKLVGESLGKYVPHASDDAILGYIRAMIQEIEELASKDPELCYQFIFPEVYGAPDATKHLKPETQRADLQALAELIRTGAEKPQVPPDREKGETLLKKVMQDFYATRGEEALLLRQPFARDVDKAKVCHLIADFYKETLKLPKEESSLLLRYMLAPRK